MDPLAEEIQPLLNDEDRTEKVTALLEEFIEPGWDVFQFNEQGIIIADGTVIELTDTPTQPTLDGTVEIIVADSDGMIVATLPRSEVDVPLRTRLNGSQQYVLDEALEASGIFLNPSLRDVNGFETIVVSIRENNSTQGVIVLNFENPIAQPGLLAGAVAIFLIPLMIPVLCLATIVGTVFGLVVARGLAVRLGKLSNSAESWSTGDFSVVVGDKSKDEIGQLGRQLNGMASELQILMQSRGQLAMIEERNRIARDLHGSAKQQIFATTMQLSTAKVLLDIDPEKAKHHLTEAETLAKAVQKELSGLIEELRPAQLEGQGIFAAVRSSAETFTRQYNIPVDIRISGERELPLNVEQPMFRILQEAFNNIAKHSEATQIVITLAATNEQLTLSIHDNGVSFDQADARTGGIGLRSMQERIEQMSGKLQVKSGMDKGTTVLVTAPLAAYHLQEVERARLSAETNTIPTGK